MREIIKEGLLFNKQAVLATEALFGEKAKAQLTLLTRLRPNPLKTEGLFFYRPDLGRGYCEGRIIVADGAFDGVGQAGMVAWVDNPDLLADVARFIDVVRPEQRVWLIESVKQPIVVEEEQETRLARLKDMGLVSRKVTCQTVSGENYCIWFGRKAKPREVREIDLTEKDWFQNIVAMVREESQRAGYSDIDFSEALEHCRASHFPPSDWGKVQLGFGVELQAPCGCRWQVDWDGCWIRKNQCAEECEGPPRPETRQSKKPVAEFLVGDNIPSKMSCRQCRTSLVFDRRIISQDGKQTLVLSDLKCPHHGLKSSRKILTDKQIRNYGSN